MRHIFDAFDAAALFRLELTDIDELMSKHGISEGAPAALFDWRALPSFDGKAAAEFSRWLHRARARISALAIVTATREWHLLLATAGLEARLRLKPFLDDDEALAWLNTVSAAEVQRRGTSAILTKLLPRQQAVG